MRNRKWSSSLVYHVVLVDVIFAIVKIVSHSIGLLDSRTMKVSWIDLRDSGNGQSPRFLRGVGVANVGIDFETGVLEEKLDPVSERNCVS